MEEVDEPRPGGIAAVVHTRQCHVSAASTAPGIPSRRAPRTYVDTFPQLRDRDWLAERIQARRTRRQIAEELGCSIELVAQRIREAGLIGTKPPLDKYVPKNPRTRVSDPGRTGINPREG